MLGCKTNAPPWMATTVLARRGLADCKVHTGIPSNSLRCTFSPSVVNHGGLSLVSSCASGIASIHTEDGRAEIRDPRGPGNAAVMTWATNDGSPVNVAGAAVALSCVSWQSGPTRPQVGAPISPVIAGSIDWPSSVGVSVTSPLVI